LDFGIFSLGFHLWNPALAGQVSPLRSLRLCVKENLSQSRKDAKSGQVWNPAAAGQVWNPAVAGPVWNLEFCIWNFSPLEFFLFGILTLEFYHEHIWQSF
jgi:hypothetical protein